LPRAVGSQAFSLLGRSPVCYSHPMKASPVPHRNVLITGCSTGIGLAAARLMKEKGWHVFPTARKDDDLQMLEKEGFVPIHLDVADESSVTQAADKLLDLTESRVGAIVNNAGFGQPGAIEDLTREAMRYQFEVNVFGLQQLTNRLVPVFRKQGFGRIVNVSSILGRMTLPMMGIYSASKFALESMSDAMRIELRGSGVAVSIVEPGPIKTEFGRNAIEKARTQIDTVDSHFQDRYKRKLEVGEKEWESQEPLSLPPQAVAVKIAHALESPRPRRRYPVTAVAWIGSFMVRFAPAALMDAMLAVRLETQDPEAGPR